MQISGFIHQLIGTKKIIIKDVSYDPISNIITVYARLQKSIINRCGICGKRSKHYDNGRGSRVWRCLDVGTSKTFIEATCPRVECAEHGVKTCTVPWANHSSRFTKNFEEMAAWLTVNTPKSTVAKFMRISWTTVGDICSRVYQNLSEQVPSGFDNLRNIGIDETSYKKGHKYLTVVVNHDTSTVIWVGIGHNKTVLSKFFKLLTAEQRSAIECVTADGARWIANCIEEYCPGAERCVDPFHVVSWATEVLDSIRKEAWREANRTVQATQKRGKGRPKKGENVNPEKQTAVSIKGLRYVLLKNPEHLTEGQRNQLNLLIDANPKMYRSYLLKEGLRLAITSGADEIETALDKWLSWAQRCRIDGFLKLRQKIKHHKDAIIATAKHHLSNARIEATNNKIKNIVHRAYGFRNTDNLMSMIMLTCSSVTPTLPWG